MTRQLRAEEQALWAQVAATITPLDPQSSRTHTDKLAETATRLPQDPPRHRAQRASASIKPAGKSPALPAASNTTPRAETLDRSWDRRLSAGRVQPDLVIDLHGMTREAARQHLQARVRHAAALGFRIILVITGKGMRERPSAIDLMQEKPVRGAIRAALPQWIGESSVSPCIAAIRQAHPRHGGSGAVYLILKRRR